MRKPCAILTLISMLFAVPIARAGDHLVSRGAVDQRLAEAATERAANLASVEGLLSSPRAGKAAAIAFARERGFTAIAYAGDAQQLREMVAKGRPLIVAWALAPGRFHNVVVVGVDRARNVIVNDPAVGAGRTLSAADFEKRWVGAGRWTLLVQPADR